MSKNLYEESRYTRISTPVSVNSRWVYFIFFLKIIIIIADINLIL